MSSAFTNLGNIIATNLQNCIVIPICKLVCSLAVSITTEETKKEKENLKPQSVFKQEEYSVTISTDDFSCENKVKEFMSRKNPYVANPHLYLT